MYLEAVQTLALPADSSLSLNYCNKKWEIPGKKRKIIQCNKYIRYARHYKPRLVYPIFHGGLYCRAVYNVERLISYV